MDFHTLCNQYGQIFNKSAEVNNEACSVSLARNLHVTIQGRPSKGELHAEFSFESLDVNGHALNLGEVVLLEEEVPEFMKQLVNNGIMISALHNHWLFTNPTILYIHFQSVEPPLAFAQKAAAALRVLR